ncbi:MAG: GGDEF and EAL domain-containing protein [Lachnospiraceae bacterium]|nr:GGDEF and EAL domain-containing protein [Lachnospiraceae bacterium]
MSEDYIITKSGGIIPTGLPGGFFIYEAQGEQSILYAEPNVIRLYDCDSFEEFYEYVGGTFSGMVHPDDIHKVQNQIVAQTTASDKRHDYVRYRIITKKGEVKFIEDFGHLLHWRNGKSFFYVFIVDVDQNEFFNENRNSFAEAELLSSHQDTDPLTGLFNMSFFYHQVAMDLSSLVPWKGDMAFIHFDIPNFKLYNERYGFNAGDNLLCDFSRAIVSAFNSSIVSRFSDDHFVVFSKNSRDEVLNQVEQVYKTMLNSEDTTARVRIKAGIYFPEDRRPEVGLSCDHARLACNSIKSRHDYYYCIYDEALREKLRRQQYVVDHVEEAVAKEYIKVFYQPVINLGSGKICGYEALVRWIDPVIGFLSPGDFIETLEQFHLIHLVDRFVIKKVCEDYKNLKDAGEDVVPVSLNISRLDFELCDIFGILEATREEYDVPRSMLDIEITESALNDNVKYISHECDKMRTKGYSLWLDDFGSGYSSLNTIAEYDFDVLKLDMIFLRSFDTNLRSRELMRYIIKGACGLGLNTLCEGVETEEQCRFLQMTGCDKAQGFYFGKPMPMEETRAFTREKGLVWEKN